MAIEDQVKSRGVLASLPARETALGHEQYLTTTFSYAYDGPQIDYAPPRSGKHAVEILIGLGLGNDTLTGLRAAGVIDYSD